MQPRRGCVVGVFAIPKIRVAHHKVMVAKHPSGVLDFFVQKGRSFRHKNKRR